MIEDLLALLIALQHVELDGNQRISLQQLGNKCANFVKKSAFAEDWENIQQKIETLLSQDSQLKERYQSTKLQLQSLDPKELQTLLPSPELIAPFKSECLGTLGYLPDSFSPKSSETENVAVEIENTVMELAIIILKHDDSSKASQQYLDKDKLSKK